MERSGKPWSREEIVATLALYCQLPFGSFHEKNAQVIALAAEIGRKPGAVAMKLGNLASLDPVHEKRGVKGLAKRSQLDEKVWREFYGHWERLIHEVPDSISAAIPYQESPRTRIDQPTETQATIKVRRGQTFFRNAVLAAYDGKCCVTSIAHRNLLRASHIVPWAENDGARLDPCNGLCLNALHDAAFDQGLMTLDEDYRVVYAKALRDAMPPTIYNEFFRASEGRAIHIATWFGPNSMYLTHHRERIFAA